MDRIAVLVPHFDAATPEEQYASWQAQHVLRQDAATLALYDPEGPASDAVSDIEADYALVVLDPLLIPPPRLGSHLREKLEATPGADAAVPASNASEPMAFLCRIALLDDCHDVPRHALSGREVVVARDVPVRRRAAKTHPDDLTHVPEDCHTLIELGCGDGAFGAAIKARQRCRVTGVEPDPRAAALARRRLDDVYCGEIRHVVSILDQRFDCILLGDLLDRVEDPWTLLADVRRIAAPRARIVFRVTNAAHPSIVDELAAGRIDYAAFGLRLFTKASITEMLEVTGWKVLSMSPATERRFTIVAALQSRMPRVHDPVPPPHQLSR